MKPKNYIFLRCNIVLLFFISLNVVQAQDLKNSFKLNFTPTGGYRILVDDSATGLLPGFRDYENMRFGMSGNLEYTRNVTKWLSISAAIEYQYFEYGGIQNFYSYDSINNFTSAGTVKTSFIHHYLGIPIKFYFNLVQKEKFRLYTFIGVNPKIALIREYATELNDTVNNINSSFHQMDPEDFNPNYHRNVFNIEGMVGIGFNFNLSKRVFIDMNAMFGMNMLRSNKDTPINDYIYRAGGNVGLGYSF